MAHLRWTKGTRFLWNGVAYEIKDELGDGRVLLGSLNYANYKKVLTTSALDAAWAREELVGEVTEGRYTCAEAGSPIATRYNVEPLQDLDPKRHEETLRRYKLIAPFIDLPAQDRTRKKIEAYALSLRENNTKAQLAILRRDGIVQPLRSRVGEAISGRSIRRYLRMYLVNRDIRALIPGTKKQGGSGNTRLNREVEVVVNDIFNYCKTHRPAHSPGRSVSDIRDLIVMRLEEKNKDRELRNLPQLKYPDESTIWRRIYDENLQFILKRRLSTLEEQADAGVMPGPRPQAIGDIVEFDCSWLDFILVDDEDGLPLGRACACLGTDKKSGYPYSLAAGITAPGYELVSASMLHGMMPKGDVQTIYGTKHPWLAQGKPVTIVTDNGSEFYNKDLDDALIQMSIDWKRMPRKKAWFKGKIERFIGEQNTGLLHKMPGTTFSNPVKRGDYKSEQYACITYNTFIKVLHIWLLDVYAQEWHNRHGSTSRDFMGGIPAKLWEEDLQNGLALPLHNDAREARILLLPRVSEPCLIRDIGIEKDHIVYQSRELIKLRSKLPVGERKVWPKYDYTDMNYLLVPDPRAEPGDTSKYLTVESTMPKYTTGLTSWMHKKNVQKLNAEKATIDEAALIASRFQIQTELEEDFKRMKRVKSRNKTARGLGKGRGEKPGMLRSTSAISQQHIEEPSFSGANAKRATLPGDHETPTSQPKKKKANKEESANQTLVPPIMGEGNYGTYTGQVTNSDTEDEDTYMKSFSAHYALPSTFHDSNTESTTD